jgi:hypothetical protein
MAAVRLGYHLARTALSLCAQCDPSFEPSKVRAAIRLVTVRSTWRSCPGDRRNPCTRNPGSHWLPGFRRSAGAAWEKTVISELVTNAVRYGGGPIGLSLIRDGVLVCEVTGTSNTQPRMRRAHSTDEGGRSLFIVAQLVQRWGSRYGRSGKTIWAEPPLPADLGESP